MTVASLTGWEALLGQPWSAVDCTDVVREVYRLHGIELPADALTAPHPEWWEPVGKATQVLDVIASDPTASGSESHLSVLVRSESPAVALTSARMGGVATVKPWAVNRVLGVYRWRGLA